MDLKKPEPTLLDKIKSFSNAISVEVVVIFYTLPSVAASLTTQNLSFEKACRINLGYNQTVCDSLSDYKTAETEVQKLTASLYAWRDIAQSVLPAFLLLFFGSWSDRNHNRKPCLILPVVGGALSTIGYLICTYFAKLPAEYCMVSDALPIALTGNWFLFYMGVYSYVSEVSSEENRTVRLGAVTTLQNVFTTAGLGVSGVVYGWIGYYGVFISALAMYLVAICYGFSIKEKPVKTTSGDFFDVKHVSDTFRVVTDIPNSNKRRQMYWIMGLVVLVQGPWMGEASVMYLFFRHKLHWDEVDYSMYSFYGSILYTIAQIFSLSFFSKYLGMDDALVGVISSVSKILASFIFFFAASTFTFYLGVVIDVFNGTSYIALRSLLSKLVTHEELGKASSVFGLCEAITPLIYCPVYNLVYKWTLDIAPSAFFLFGAALTLPVVGIFLWLYKQHRVDEVKKEVESVNKQELLAIKSMPCP